jgi:ketosteroid isomerase-like protein
MSQENIEVVRESYDAFLARDLDAFLSFMEPDVEFRSLVLEIEGAYKGHDGIRRWWETVLAVFPDWSPQIEDARDLGDRVLVRVRVEGSGTGSGSALERDFWEVAEILHGRVRSAAFFRTEQEALEAAGLPE